MAMVKLGFGLVWFGFVSFCSFVSSLSPPFGRRSCLLSAPGNAVSPGGTLRYNAGIVLGSLWSRS